MTVLAESADARLGPGRPALFGTLGDAHTRLLAGPPAVEGAETLGDHLRRLGPLRLPDSPADVLELAQGGGILGRGGGEFPLARKLATAAAAGGSPLVVVNGSEGEPASRKDRVLLGFRPHLVLDGAEVAARAVGAADVVLYVHAGERTVEAALDRACRERLRSGCPLRLRMIAAPPAYVSGESSAVVSVLEGRGPLPRRRAAPVAASGVGGRPTVVSNAESLGHLGLLARFGAPWFAAAGSRDAPGSSLVTLAGGVPCPGLVVEVLAPVALGAVLTAYGADRPPPRAVLVGGYGGRWIGGEAALGAPLDRAALRRADVGLGCGLVAPLPSDGCGLAVTVRLLDYLGAQSAGQCGPCVHGLPALARRLREVVEGRATRRDLRTLATEAELLRGRGDCGHPDGAVALAESALSVFAEDARLHVRGRHCGGSATAGWFPLPRTPGMR